MATFDDLKMKITAESAIQEMNFASAPLSEFVHNYSELEGRRGEAIVIPDFSNLDEAGEFNPDSNNYFSGTNEVESKTVTLDKLFVKSLMFTDRDFGDTEVRFFQDGGIAIARKMADLANKYVFGLINNTNVTQTADFKTVSKDTAAGLYNVAATHDIDVGTAVVVLNPLKYSQLMSKLDANVIGSADPIRSGMIGKLYGFKSFICSNKLPEGTVGAIVGQGAIATVNRYNAPGISNAYPLTYRATDDNGLTIGFRYGTDLAKGYNYLAADMLIGAKVLIPNKVVRLTEA